MQGEPISMRTAVRRALKESGVQADESAVFLVREIIGAAGRIGTECSLEEACDTVAEFRRIAEGLRERERELDRKPLHVRPPRPWKKY